MNKTGFRRLMAFIGDFLISWSLAFLLLSQERFLRIFNQSETFDSLSSMSLKHLFVTTILCVLGRFYFALFFKLSPMQYLWGLRLNGHNFIQVRLAACLRVALMPILAILYPVDNFVFSLGKKRVSEFLTGSSLRVSSPKVSILTGVTSLSLVFILSIYSPLLYQNAFVLNPEVNYIPHKEVDIQKSRDFNLFKSYASKSFKMMTFSDLDSGRFKVQPSFEIRRKSGKLIYRPMLSLWDSSLGSKGKMKINKRFELLSLVQKFKNNDPLFDFSYPNLSSALEKDIENIGTNSSTLDKKARAELFELISKALLANPYTMAELFKKGGFYTFSYTLLKLELFNLMGGTTHKKIDFVNRGEEIFIRTLIEDDFNNELKETFFSFSELRPIVYEIIWTKGKWDKKVSQAFSSSFFNKSKWGNVVLEESKVWEKENIFNPLSIIDYLGHEKFSKEGLVKFERYIKEYYFSEAKEAYLLEGSYSDLFLASMQRVYVVLKLMKDKQGISYKQITLNTFKDIMLALKNRDGSFFGVSSRE